MESDMRIATGLVTGSGGFTLVSFATSAIPVLQVISLLVAIVSGVAGMYWMYFQNKRQR